MATTIIGVCGGSAAGKTLLARELCSALAGDAFILSQDSYYRAIGPLTKEERLHVNFDVPEAIENERLVADLNRLRLGEPIEVPIYDFATSARIGVNPPQAPLRFVVVEGLFLFCVPELRELLDFKVFVDADEASRVRRILPRDLTERGKSRDDALANIHHYVLPMHRKYIDPFRGMADRVVENHEERPAALVRSAREIAASLPR